MNAALRMLLACLLLVLAVRADAPRRALADVKEFSPHRGFFLVSSVSDKRTRVYRNGKPDSVLWEVPVYIQIPALSDDGKYIAAVYDGANILPDSAQPTDALITFYGRSGKTRVVTVGEVVRDLRKLPHSISGRPWGRVLGFQTSGKLMVVTEDHRVLLFEPERK